MNKRWVLLPVMVLLVAGRVAAADEVDYQDPKTWRQEIRSEIKARREQLTTLRETQRTELRARLAEIKDLRVKMLIESIGNRMCKINTNRTASMRKQLDTFTKILDRVEARMQTAKSGGKDVSAVEGKITTARTAISDARDMVEDQSLRPCNVTLTGTESAVMRQDAKDSLNLLQTQLKDVRQAVQSARQAVTDAIISLAQVLGENE